MTAYTVGTVPPGFTTPAERSRTTPTGQTVAMMRPLALDGSQPCTGMDAFLAESWSTEDEQDLAEICASCPFRTSCRDWAIAHERYGYWGGMTPPERRQWRKQHNITLVDRYAASLYGLTTETRDYA